MRNSINDDKLKDKVEPADKEAIEAAITEATEWLDANQLAEKDEFDGKMKEVEAICNPIMTKIYQAGGGAPGGEGGMPDMSGAGGAPDMGGGGGGGDGPTIDEVD